MAVGSQGLDPSVAHLPVMRQLRRKTTAQLNPTFIQQSPQPLRGCSLRPGKAALLSQHPIDFRLGDHPGAQGLEEQLTEKP
jgi:hypothetical protein